MYTLCTTLRQMRGLFGYSQEFVAHVVGISQPNYCKIESGKVKPGLPVLTKIAGLYHISLGDLLEKDSLILVQQVTQNPNFVNLWGGVNDIIFSCVWNIGKRGGAMLWHLQTHPQPPEGGFLLGEPLPAYLEIVFGH
jgi:DNA-binding XRE family transcriptional regulator